jgi:hypothetical protein
MHHGATSEQLREKLTAASMQRLTPFLVADARPFVESLLRETHCLVTPVTARRTKHGDHRTNQSGAYSEVTVNVSGNRYQFLITLLHEIAHAKTFQTFGKHIAAHGREWRHTFAAILQRALQANLFPAELAPFVAKQARRPDASSSRDTALQLALREYDTLDHRPLVAELEYGKLFSLDGRLILRRGERLRTRFHCTTREGIAYRVPASARVHTIYEERKVS